MLWWIKAKYKNLGFVPSFIHELGSLDERRWAT